MLLMTYFFLYLLKLIALKFLHVLNIGKMKRNKRNLSFKMNSIQHIHRDNSISVYLDGSFVKGTGRAGYACYWPEYSQLSISDSLPPGTTCARAEVCALYICLKQIEKYSIQFPIILYSDNIYVVRGFNEWMQGWKKIDFKGKAHPDLWREIFSLAERFPNVSVSHVSAHVGIEGNEIADKLAKGILSPEDLEEKQMYK